MSTAINCPAQSDYVCTSVMCAIGCQQQRMERAFPAPAMTATPIPTTGLRFVKRDGLRILQQQVIVNDLGCRYEWRDVPLEEAP
jgi:hypothetical protein